MMRSPGTLLRMYRCVSPVAARAASLASPWSAKLAEGLSGRVGLEKRLQDAAGELQNCLWFHASSVGEFEQARPLIEKLRTLRPGLKIAATHFSPSGMHFARRRPAADFHDYLPLDDPQAMRRLVAAWNPRALVIVSADVWPNLVLAAEEAGVATALLSAGLPPESSRLGRIGRLFYRDLLSRLSHIGTCTEADRERFQRILPDASHITVTGNTRTEQVIRHYEETASGPTAAALNSLAGRRLVLGSTWPPDEAVWLPVLPQLLQRFSDLSCVLTPHEPHEKHLAELETRLAHDALPSVRLSRLEADPGSHPAARVVVVDSVGKLAEIYRSGCLAYVGGAFTTGVHNTMEPAVAGLPVLFGPRIGNAEEAGELVRQGGGWIITRPDEALRRASELLEDEAALKTAAEAARRVVEDQRGATERSLAVILQLLDRADQR